LASTKKRRRPGGKKRVNVKERQKGGLLGACGGGIRMNDPSLTVGGGE